MPLSEFQTDMVDHCLCGAEIYYNNDDEQPVCPGCICNIDDYGPQPSRDVPGFIRLWDSADAVFVRGLKMAP